MITPADTRSNAITTIVQYLNAKAGTNYRVSGAAIRRHINARLNEGYTVADFQKVIDNKTADWLGTEWEKYLRPGTLFCPKHFEEYLNGKINKKQPKRAIVGGRDIVRRDYTAEQMSLLFTPLDEDE